ncbi:nitrogen fixation protein FixH [Chryseobacterium sp. Leaf180]|jgi:hypothetical protein|uniref:FixH family protein n=1 Tax=Chryseobacterium sp. Leaf180 TaxID=1736289 RepID=UPI0006FB9287|nr:FixH family protein [Chryseobacterium sp. Leaf180]KQR95045.1 nitrogen fixation protein FixH [Chryseobacterium sp. Leaf180]
MKNISWGHGVIFALAAFMIFILSMLFLFPSGKQNSELVTDNYYEEELEYQTVIDAKQAADTLKIKPQYSQNPAGITIKFPENVNNGNSKFHFVLNRTDDKNLDIKKDIVLDATNSFLIPKAVLVNGNYTLRLSWTKDKTAYRLDYDVIWK